MDTAPSTANYGLTEEEERLLYNVEVLRLPVTRAGEVAGVANPHNVLKRPAVAGAREQLRNQLRVRTQITREDVVQGLKEAVEQAVILADPMAQIAGWREIAKILGYDKTPTVQVHLTGSVEQMQKQIQSLPMEELLKLGGASDVIDADFYKVKHDGEDRVHSDLRPL